MKPTVAAIRPTTNPILTNMMISYMNDEASFVATRAAPVVPVSEESGTYFTFDATYWFKDQLERRAYGDGYARGGYSLGSDTYKTLQWGLEHPIPDEHRATSQVPMALESLAIEWLGTQSLMRKEGAFATDFMTTSVWTTDDTTAQDWDTTGNPINDVRTAKRTIRQALGVPGNAAVMGEIVYDALHTNAEILGMVQYTNSLDEMRRDALMASVLGLDYLLVGRAVRNTANVAQNDSLSPFIDDDCLVCIIKPGADMMTVSSMKTFVWSPGGGQGTVSSYESNETDSTIIKHKEQWDQKLITADGGYFFSDIV